MMFGSAIVFILVLSVLVLVHEAGHFFAARRAEILVEEFGFGIPPRLFGKKIGETIYSINLFPFGGFVRLHGESISDGIAYPKRAFLNKSKKTRAIVILAGVIMNFVLAVIAFAVVYSVSGIPKDTKDVSVIEVAQGSPADIAGFETGDVITKVNGREVLSNEDFLSAVKDTIGKEAVFSLRRGEKIIEIKAIPRENPPQGQGALGVVVSTTSIFYPPLWQRPFVGIYYGFREALFWTGMITAGLINMIVGLFRGVVPKDVAGPVGIYALTSQAASLGVLALVNFVGVLSVNLAILNVLPFPALDGGRMLFIVIERFLGRRVIPRVENIIHAAGMAILMLLLFAVTFADIRRLVLAGSVDGFLKNLVK
jgi:regulator of sigma E protease